MLNLLKLLCQLLPDNGFQQCSLLLCSHLTRRWLSHNYLIAPVVYAQLTCLIHAHYLALGQTTQKIPSLSVLLLLCVYPLLWKHVCSATALQWTISFCSIISPFWCHVTTFTLTTAIFFIPPPQNIIKFSSWCLLKYSIRVLLSGFIPTAQQWQLTTNC